MRLRPHAYAGSESHGIDLAPMLDFVVNLLIFFIITAVFVKQAGLEVARPSKVETVDGGTSKPIVIDESGAISIDLKSIDLRADCVDVITRLREEGVLAGPNPFAWIPLQLSDDPEHETIANLVRSLENRPDGDDDVETVFIVTSRPTYPGEVGQVPDRMLICPVSEFEDRIRKMLHVAQRT